MSSPWPWHFVSVSTAEKERRRELLDIRGYYAQCSLIVAIIAIRFYRSYLRKIDHKGRTQSRQGWWDWPPFPGWTETRKQYLVCFVWLGWLTSLSIWNTGDDYLHLTKALGHVALSQLPFQVLMSPASYISTSRPISPSIASAVTSIPQPALSAYHRLFGRVVLSPLLLGHAVLYAGFFIQSSHPDFSSLLAKRVQDPDVQWGIGGIIAAISLLLLTRPTGPRRGLQVWATSSIKTRRQVFYVVHVVLVGALCLAAYCHVAQAQSFVMQTLGSFVINGAWCWVMMR
ncbi:hypothetical protein AWENTII_001473 [Aspergillus wentii]